MSEQQSDKNSDAKTPEEREEEFQKKLSELTPEQAEMFVEALEMAMKKRRLMLFGHLGALISLIVGSLFAVWVYANRERGEFVGWVFLIPFLGAGLCLSVFGKLAKTVRPPSK